MESFHSFYERELEIRLRLTTFLYKCQNMSVDDKKELESIEFDLAKLNDSVYHTLVEIERNRYNE